MVLDIFRQIVILTSYVCSSTKYKCFSFAISAEKIFLFEFLLASGAVASHPHLGANNIKSFDFANALFHMLRKRAMKFHDFTTAEAHHMVVLSGWLYLIMVVVFVKVKFIDQAQFLEQPQISVNSGQANAGVFFTCLTVDFMSIQMTLSPADNVQNQGALIGNSHPGFT